MTHSIARKLGVCVAATALVAATSAPGFAAERASRPSAARPTLLSQARSHVQQLAKLPTPPVARSAQEGPGGYDEPGTFLSSKRGIALLVLAGAGIGYMWYSKVHDRIHSQARERLDN